MRLQQTGHTVDARGFQRFIQSKRRKDTVNAGPAYSYPCPAVRSKSGCGHRPRQSPRLASPFPALHLLQIGAVGLSRFEQCLRIHAHGYEGEVPARNSTASRSVFTGITEALHHGGFGCIISRHDNPRRPRRGPSTQWANAFHPA